MPELDTYKPIHGKGVVAARDVGPHHEVVADAHILLQNRGELPGLPPENALPRLMAALSPLVHPVLLLCRCGGAKKEDEQ
jgi:hypothetical protein